MKTLMGDWTAMLRFRFMVTAFRLRDWRRPRREVLREVGIQPGSCVLDFGCGTGSYILETARLVGGSGIIHVLDRNPLAVRRARSIAQRGGLTNVRTILSDGATGLPDENVDTVLLFDILHDLSDRERVLGELHRVLKPGGMLSVGDHHLSRSDIVTRVTSGRRFRLKTEGPFTLGFARTG